MEPKRAGGEITMNKRKGTVALILLILFSALLTVSAGVLVYMSRTSSTVTYYEKGLASVYGAESGANWALAYLKQGHKGNKTVAFTLGDVNVKVVISEMNETAGEIRSSATDAQGGHKRFLRLTYTTQPAEAGRRITVEDISSEKF